MLDRTFLGTGLIGAGLVDAALERGEPVTVWNRTHTKALALGARGAVVCEDITTAVQHADLVHIALTSDQAVDAVVEQVIPALKPGAILIDHSTTSVEGTARRQRDLAKRGVDLLDAPVFMSPAACRAAAGVIVVGGDKNVFERAQSAIEKMTGTTLYLGDAPGRAAAMKLVGNGLILSLVGGLADAFAVGAPHGVSPHDVLGLFEHFDLGWVLSGRGTKMADADFETSWTLRMARKDIGLMLDAADAPLGVLPGLAARADALIGAGFGEQDVGVLACDSTKTTKENA